MSQQPEKLGSLFEPIKMEAIELEPEEGAPVQSVPVFSRFQVAILMAMYLLVFVGNGDITIPLFLAIPLIIINIFSSSLDIILPSLIGASGLILVARRLVREPVSRQQSATANLGLILMLSSLFFYWTVSEAVAATFVSSALFCVL
ncbi:MAG: hypothetical protein J0653_00635, partial [Deltaproteobacteria bacterium]|nr:hypothetical protein [Deltaproteobacteria bacterium]